MHAVGAAVWLYCLLLLLQFVAVRGGGEACDADCLSSSHAVIEAALHTVPRLVLVTLTVHGHLSGAHLTHTPRYLHHVRACEAL